MATGRTHFALLETPPAPAGKIHYAIMELPGSALGRVHQAFFSAPSGSIVTGKVSYAAMEFPASPDAQPASGIKQLASNGAWWDVGVRQRNSTGEWV